MKKLSLSDLTNDQTNAIDFMVDHKSALLLADVGTGKTVITLTALDRLIDEGSIGGTLIIAPKRVAENVWRQEMQEWSHLTGMYYDAKCISGLSPAKRKAVIEDEEVSIIIMNYELIPWLTENYPDGLAGYDTIVFDEIDKMKDVRSVRYKGKPRRTGKPRVCGMKSYRRHFTRHIGLTGTPTPKHLLDLFAQCYLMVGWVAFGKSFYKFREQHFFQTDWHGYDFSPHPTTPDFMRRTMHSFTFRIEQPEDMGIPETVELPPRVVTLSGENMKDYKKLEREYIATVDGGEVEVETAAQLYGKLRQMAQGFVYDRGGSSRSLSGDKYTELDSLLSELQGQQLMVVYHFIHQQDELERRFRMLRFGNTTEAFECWNKGATQILAIHPQSAGHGLNLQKSGAHHIVFLTLPESAGLYKQVIGRLVRTGNPASTVYVHRILCDNTVDLETNARVHGELESQQAFLDAMKERQS